MSDWIYDYHDNEPLYQMDDDYAVGKDGHIVQNVDGNWGFEPGTGEFHMTSGWGSSDDDSEEDDDLWRDDSVTCRHAAPSGKISNQGNSSTYNSGKGTYNSKKSAAAEHPGCAAIFWGFIAAVVVCYWAGEAGDSALAYTVWILVAIIVAAVLISGNRNRSSSSGTEPVSYTSWRGSESRDDDSLFYFCTVRVAKNGGKYCYRCPDSSIRDGDYVIVPKPDGAAGVPGEVLEARFYSRSEVPVPLETAKYVREKIDAEKYFALIGKAESKAEKDEKPPQKAGGEAAGESAPDASAQKTTKRLRVTVWILAGVVVCMAAAMAVMAIGRSPAEPPEATEVTAATESPAPTDTPEPAPESKTLTGAETERAINKAFAELKAASDYLDSFSDTYWEPDDVQVMPETVRSLEKTWADYRDGMYAVLAELDEKEPATEYRLAMDTLKQAVRDMAYAADLLSDWDANGDGGYTAEEISSVNNDAFLPALNAQMHVMNFSEDYADMLATPTPRPTATPKRSTPKSNSDPYNASDYNNPEFFYDDWYDDFYDYDEAEDYWEEYGDW